MRAVTTSNGDAIAAGGVEQPVRVGWIANSPIHYHAPLFRLLATDPRLDLTVVYLRAGMNPRGGGYSEEVVWDVDLLSGYRSESARRARRNTSAGGLKGHVLWDPDVILGVRRGRFDVLVVDGYISFTRQLAALAQLSLHRPVMFREEQTLLTPRAAWKTALKQVWLPQVFKHCYGLCIGTENDRWFARWGIPERRRFLVPYAADNQRLEREFSQIAGDREAVRREFGLPAGDVPVILLLGRLIPKKAPLLLLRAFARLRSKMPCALLYVGSGPLGPEIEAESRRLGLADVHLAGFLNQSKVVRAYLAADLFVLPSEFDETWGIVVNEAMVCGLPVIVSDRVGSGTDLVHEGANGFVVRAGDVDALERAMAELVSSPEKRRRFGNASQQIVQTWTNERGATNVAEAIAHAVGPERWSAAWRDHG